MIALNDLKKMLQIKQQYLKKRPDNIYLQAEVKRLIIIIETLQLEQQQCTKLQHVNQQQQNLINKLEIICLMHGIVNYRHLLNYYTNEVIQDMHRNNELSVPIGLKRFVINAFNNELPQKCIQSLQNIS